MNIEILLAGIFAVIWAIFVVVFVYLYYWRVVKALIADWKASKQEREAKNESANS